MARPPADTLARPLPIVTELDIRQGGRMHLRRLIAVATVATAMIAAFAIAAAAATLASYDHAPVSGPWSLAPGEYYVDLTGTSFRTSTGYDGQGHIVPLGGTTQERSFRSYVELGWKPRWSLQLSVPFTTLTQRPLAGPVASVTGLGDFGVGLRRSFVNGPRAASLQLLWETPAGNNPSLTPSVGDGLQKLSATAQFGGVFCKDAFWQLGGGYRFQYNGTSELTDQVTRRPDSWRWAEHVITNGAVAMWLGKLQASGQFAADLSSFRPLEYPHTVTSVALGTRFTYRTDGRLDVYAGSWHTPSGVNALALNQYYAGLAWKSTKLNRVQGFLGGDARP
jgi:hypothetical protein